MANVWLVCGFWLAYSEEKKRLRCCTLIANLAFCSWNWKNGHSEKESTADELLDLPWHILKFATTENHFKHEISVVGQGGCRLTVYVQI